MNVDSLNPISIKSTNGVTHVHFLFEGPAGKIEAVLSLPDASNNHNAFAIVCHPHPLHGGSLTNKVTHFIAKSLNDLNVPTLRFNFRGVGQSEGEHAAGIGECDDLLTAVHFMKKHFHEEELWLAGFSFGAFITLASAVECGAKKLISVAPAVHLYDFRQIDLPNNDWLLIQGDADEIVPWKEAIEWAKGTPNAPEIFVMKGAGHFFHGRLNELRDVIVNHIQNQTK